MPWDRYLANMAQDGEYGDQIALQAAAEIFNIEIFVVSSLGPDATADIAEKSIIPMAQIQLGHFAEGDGEHYVCVGGDFQSDEQSIEDIDHQLLEKPSRRRARATEKPKAQKLTSMNCKTTNSRVQWTVKYKFVLFQIVHWLETI